MDKKQFSQFESLREQTMSAIDSLSLPDADMIALKIDFSNFLERIVVKAYNSDTVSPTTPSIPPVVLPPETNIYN